SIAELARIGLGERDELLEVLRRQRRVDDEYWSETRDEGHRREIAKPVVRQVLADHRTYDARHRMIEQRVAVGRCAHDRVDTERAARTAHVLDHHLLADHL